MAFARTAKLRTPALARNLKQIWAGQDKILRVQPIKLLVVEDNQGDVVLLRECLRDSAFPLELTLAKDGEIAVNLLFEQGFRPDLIVLDLNLPKLDGHEVLKALGSNGIGAIPVIIMTS